MKNIRLNSPLISRMLLVLLLLAGSLVIYGLSGRYTMVKQGQEAHYAFQHHLQETSPTQRNERYILTLQNQLRDDPNDGDRWFELGQAYALNNEFDAALICYRNATQLLGEKSAILGAMASAAYYGNQKQFSPEIQAWIGRAQALDPLESSTWLLLATDHFSHQRYEQAIQAWRKVLESNNPALDRRAIIESIRVAEALM